MRNSKVFEQSGSFILSLTMIALTRDGSTFSRNIVSLNDAVIKSIFLHHNLSCW